MDPLEVKQEQHAAERHEEDSRGEKEESAVDHVVSGSTPASASSSIVEAASSSSVSFATGAAASAQVIQGSSPSTPSSSTPLESERHAEQMATTPQVAPCPSGLKSEPEETTPRDTSDSSSWQPFMKGTEDNNGQNDVWSPNNESAFRHEPLTPGDGSNGDSGLKQTPVGNKSGVKRKLDPQNDSHSDSPGLDEKQKKLRADEKRAKFSSGKDYWCWTCHKERANISCVSCDRSFHPKCLTPGINSRKNNSKPIVCFECKQIAKAERKPPKAIRCLDIKELNELIQMAIESVKPSADGSFYHIPVSTHEQYAEYKACVIHPMDFEMMEKKAKNSEYKSSQEFLADVAWIVHNCTIIHNGNSLLAGNARQLAKNALTKIVDLEICPDCYKNFHQKPKTWFTEVCRRPHALVWAKVTGHPFWPGKVVQIRNKSEADVRFFGAHERSWLAFSACLLITENNCSAKSKNSRSKFELALKEMNEHIAKIEAKFNIKYPYAEPKTAIDPQKQWVKVSDDEDIYLESEPEEDFPDDDANLEMDIKDEGNDSQDDSLKIAEESDSGPVGHPVDPVAGDKASNGAKDSAKKPRGKPKKSLEPKASTEIIGRGESSDTDDKSNVKIESMTDGKTGTPVSDGTKPGSGVKSSNPRTNFNKKSLSNKNRTSLNQNSPSTTSPLVPKLEYPFVPHAAVLSSGVGSPFSMSGIEAVDDGAEDTQDVGTLKRIIGNLKKQLADERSRCLHVIKTEKDRTDQLMIEMKMNSQKEKDKALRDVKIRLDQQHQNQIAEVKKHQWCAQCSKEAVYYCCWNTSYCSYECQSSHWQFHMSSCQQQRQTQVHPTSNSSNPSLNSTAAASRLN